MRIIRPAAAILLALAATTYIAVNVRDARVHELTEKVDRLEQERKKLADFARRITATRRVAQVDVLEQTFSPDGETATFLRFQEIGDTGTIGEPVYREALGDLIYFEAATLKFDHDRVGSDETEQTTSLALFRRIFGDRQIAAAVKTLRTDHTIAQGPDLRGSREAQFQFTGAGDSAHAAADPWDMFWNFMDDPDLAQTYGVRVAQIEAPAIAPKTGQTWQLSLDASGGLNVVLLNTARTTHVRRIHRADDPDSEQRP